MLLAGLFITVLVLAANNYHLRQSLSTPPNIESPASDGCENESRKLLDVRWAKQCTQQKQPADCTLVPRIAKELTFEFSLYLYSCMQNSRASWQRPDYFAASILWETCVDEGNDPKSEAMDACLAKYSSPSK